MSKHTPGPWWVTDHGVRDAGGYICHTNNAPHYQGQDERYAKEVSEREANKHLIAAAPDLFEALTWAEANPTDDAYWITQARAAIAKATGE